MFCNLGRKIILYSYWMTLLTCTILCENKSKCFDLFNILINVYYFCIYLTLSNSGFSKTLQVSEATLK